MSARRCDRLLQTTTLLERDCSLWAILPQSGMLRAQARPVPTIMLEISQKFRAVAVAFSSIHQDRMRPESGTSTRGEATSTLTSSAPHRAVDDASMWMNTGFLFEMERRTPMHLRSLTWIRIHRKPMLSAATPRRSFGEPTSPFMIPCPSSKTSFRTSRRSTECGPMA